MCGTHERRLDGSRNVCARCPTRANDASFWSDFHPLRALYTLLLLSIFDAHMILSVLSTLDTIQSTNCIRQDGSMVQSVVMVWYFSTLQKCLVAVALWIYNSTNWLSVRLDAIYYFTTREHSLSIIQTACDDVLWYLMYCNE
jgi:hypothetical protein